jgi:spore coat protein U-like protein
MLMKRTLLAAAVAAVVGLSLNASANVSNTTFTVTLVVQKTCNVNTVTNVNLGTVNAGALPAIANGTFTVACSNTTPYYIGLAPNSTTSTTGAGNMNGQTAGNTGTLIAYQLYQNAGGTTVWGNTATTTSAGNGESGTGAGMTTPTTFTVYAGVTGSTNVTPDTYKDTVTVNVNF